MAELFFGHLSPGLARGPNLGQAGHRLAITFLAMTCLAVPFRGAPGWAALNASGPSSGIDLLDASGSQPDLDAHCRVATKRGRMTLGGWVWGVEVVLSIDS
jgi:hypothetical protein